MEKQRRDRHRYGDGGHGTANSPSFSSTLLDEIYRSIDDNGSNGTVKRTNNVSSFHARTSTMAVATTATSISDLQRASATRRNSVNSASMSSISCSSSTDSCSKRGESESRYSSSCYTIKRPKPIRTSSVSRPENNNTGVQGSRFERNQGSYTSGAVHESDFTKKKSKALKIYGDLKRIKQQPISPGARLASFLNSLLGSPKKPNFSNSKPNHSKSSNQNHNYYNDNTYRSTTPSSSTCSSATSFSRSCLSKTPSSTSGAKPNGTAKRSVRFYPVSVIVDEESRPCGHKNLYEGNQDSDDGVRHREEINFEAARELLKKYQAKKKDNGDDNEDDDEDEEEEEEEDDGGSCASSDLFELDNLSVFELPVYETTNIQIPANSAIF